MNGGGWVREGVVADSSRQGRKLWRGICRRQERGSRQAGCILRRRDLRDKAYLARRLC